MSTNDPNTDRPGTKPVAERPLTIGDPLPDVQLIDHDGEPWRRTHGRPLVLILHRHLA